MAGLVHVVPGDLAHIDADVIGYSTDRAVPGSGLMHRAFVDAFPGFGSAFGELRTSMSPPVPTGTCRWLHLRGTRARGPRPVGIAVTVATGRDADIGTVVRNTLELAVERLGPRTEAPLIALPAYLAGYGGAWHQMLATARPQVDAACRFVQDHDVDVAFITFTDATYEAWTVARRDALREASAGRLDTIHPEPWLVESVRRGECVLFVGAGMSAGAGFPGWSSLIDTITARLGIPESQRQGDVGFFLDLAQWYREAKLHPQVEELIGAAFSSAATGIKPSLAHGLIAALPTRFFVTANFDDLIEQALHAQRRYPVRVVADQDVARTGDPEGIGRFLYVRSSASNRSASSSTDSPTVMAPRWIISRMSSGLPLPLAMRS